MDPGRTRRLSFSEINALQVGKRSRGAAAGLLFYDHMISLDKEVEYIWLRKKKPLPFFLYIFNRFFAFAYLIFDLIPLTKSGVVNSRCIIYLMCNDLVTLITTLTMQVILQIRVYALWERSRRVLGLLLALCVAEVVTMTVLVGVTISNLHRTPVISTGTGCAYQGMLEISALFWIPGLVFEPILFFLVAYKAWGGDSPKSRMISKLARDSMMYFAVVFAVLLASTFIWSLAPSYINIIMPWSAALPSMLGSRLLLGMREAVERQGDQTYILETFSRDINMSSVIFRDQEADLAV